MQRAPRNETVLGRTLLGPSVWPSRLVARHDSIARRRRRRHNPQMNFHQSLYGGLLACAQAVALRQDQHHRWSASRRSVHAGSPRGNSVPERNGWYRNAAVATQTSGAERGAPVRFQPEGACHYEAWPKARGLSDRQEGWSSRESLPEQSPARSHGGPRGADHWYPATARIWPSVRKKKDRAADGGASTKPHCEGASANDGPRCGLLVGHRGVTAWCSSATQRQRCGVRAARKLLKVLTVWRGWLGD